ncbi:MAG: adenylate/guanylate cyclase domain-containing protein [Gammaproteobacteria bacterium]
MLPFAKPYIGHLTQYAYLEELLASESNFTSSVKQQINKVVPTTFKGYDVTRGVLIFILLVLHARVSGLQFRVSTKLEYYEEEDELQKFIEEKNISSEVDSSAMQTLRGRLDSIKNASKKDRKALVRDFMEIKQQLDIMGRNLIFLSIDMVGSTVLKTGSDPISVAFLFDEYNAMVSQILKENQYLKMSSTPDGVMACFEAPDKAINAAQTLIKTLPEFNEKIKFQKGEVKIRCGANMGFVYYDENEPLENISDHTIDIAGHMQKYAEPNSIYAPMHLVNQLANPQGFEDLHKEIDGCKVYRWEVEVKQASQ